MPIEVRGDCNRCLVEGATLESEELERDVRCRVCTEGSTPQSFEELERSLRSWAIDEGLASAQELVDAYFVLTTVQDVFLSLQRGELVETTFDVADYLFSGGAAGGAAAGGTPTIARRDDPATERLPLPAARAPIHGGPREELFALASVAAADGEASEEDQRMLVLAAAKRQIAPPVAAEVRVWRANELAPPATLLDRERVLEELFQLAWSDGQMDASELRVIRDFARAWGIDPERLKQWTEMYSVADESPLVRWVGRLAQFVFPVR